MNFEEIRQKYPEYNDMSDADFAQGFHKKFYSDMSFDDFASKVGYAVKQPQQKQEPSVLDELGRAIPNALSNVGASTARTGAELASFLGNYTEGGKRDLKHLENVKGKINQFFGVDKNIAPETLPGRAAETIATVAPYTANLPTALLGMGTMYTDKVDELVKQGVSKSDARKSALAYISAMAATGFGAGKIAAPLVEKAGGNLLARMGAGSAGFGAATEAGRVASNAVLPEDSVGQRPFDPEELAVNMLAGVPFGIAHSKGPNKTLSSEEAAKKLIEEEQRQTQQQPGPNTPFEVRQFAPEEYPDNSTLGVGNEAYSNKTLQELDNQMMQRPQDLQAPQFGGGGRMARPDDYAGRAKPDFEPGERATQESMDLERLRFAADQKEAEINKAWEDLQKNTTLSKEEAFAEQERLQKEQEQADEIRRQLFEEEANNQVEEPSQHGVDIESPQERTTYRPSVNGGKFGQGGAVDLSVFKEGFDKLREGAFGGERNKDVVSYNDTMSAVPKDVHTNMKRMGTVMEPDQAIEAFKSVKDMQPSAMNVAKEQVASSGRLQRDLLDHPVTTQIYNVTTKAIESARQAARHILDDYGTGVIPKIRQFVMLNSRGQGEMREYVKWRLANEATDTQLPDNFSPQVKNIHEMLNKADAQLLDKMNKVLSKDGKKPIEGLNNHMVHYWSGPYRAYIYLKTESGSRLAYYVAEKSKAEAEAAVNWIRKNVPNIDLDKTQGVSFVKSDARNRSSMFDHLLDQSNEQDPVITEALQQFNDSVAAAQERHLGEHNRQKLRVGVQGFLGNKPWLSEARNYSDAIDTIRTKYDAGYQWIAAQEVRQQMAPILKAQAEGQLSVGNALSAGQRYVDHAFGRNIDVSPLTKLADYLESNSSAFGSARRSTATAYQAVSQITIPWLLMLRGAQVVQGTYQVLQATIPKMMEGRITDQGSYANIPHALAGGLMDGMMHLMDTVTVGKASDIRDMFHETMGTEQSKLSKAINQALSDYDIARISLSDVGSSTEGGFVKSWANQAKETVLNAPMNLIEGPTRAWAFSSFVRQAVLDGHSIETAIQMGRESMDTMTNYNPEAAPMGLSNLGVIGAQARGLHTFMANYYTQLARYVGEAKKSGRNVEPLLAYLGMTFVASGMVGFIGRDLVDWGLDIIKDLARGTKMDSPELQKMSLKKWILENNPEWASVGPLSSSTGLGLYGSFTTKVVDPDRSFIENVFPKVTATASMIKSATQIPKLFSEETSDREKGKVLEGIAPKFMTQHIRNKYQNMNGTVYDVSEHSPGLPMYQRTPKEQKISEHGLGVRGLSEAMATEQAMEYRKGEKNVSQSQKAVQEDMNRSLVAMMKSYQKNGVVDPFQKRALEQKASDLITKWDMDKDKLTKDIQRTATDYGMPDDLVRQIVVKASKTNPSVREAKQIQDLARLRQTIKERQNVYGR